MDAHSGHNETVRGQFSKQAESYGRLTSAMNTDRSVSLRALVAATADDVVLDICCGPGLLALDLAPHVAHVTGLDLTPAMLEQARANQALRGVSNIAWQAGDANALPFADASFSLVTCSAAFHHLVSPRRVFREMVRVCRTGGRIVVRDVTPDADKSAAYDRMEKLRDPSHAHALTPEEMNALGTGMPVGSAQSHRTLTADLPLDSILATSFPEACSVDELRAMFRADAISGEDKLGFRARLIGGNVHVSYPMSTVIWAKE